GGFAFGAVQAQQVFCKTIEDGCIILRQVTLVLHGGITPGRATMRRPNDKFRKRRSGQPAIDQGGEKAREQAGRVLPSKMLTEPRKGRRGSWCWKGCARKAQRPACGPRAKPAGVRRPVPSGDRRRLAGNGAETLRIRLWKTRKP